MNYKQQLSLIATLGTGVFGAYLLQKYMLFQGKLGGNKPQTSLRH
jgi:hypothetical protein